MSCLCSLEQTGLPWQGLVGMTPTQPGLPAPGHRPAATLTAELPTATQHHVDKTTVP